MLSYLLFMIDTLRVAFPVITLFAAAPTFFILWLILRLITFIGVSRHNYRYYDDMLYSAYQRFVLFFFESWSQVQVRRPKYFLPFEFSTLHSDLLSR